MKRLNILLIIMIIILSASHAFALYVGFNVDIHNGTGVDAYDFHIEGTLKSSTPPTQVAEFISPISFIPGFDWTYSGGTITPLGGDFYSYSGSWAGTTPVKTSQSIHVGKYFDETCNNVWVDVIGYWTDINGQRITTNTSDVPLAGFIVDDQSPTQTLTLFNDTGINTHISGLEVAVTDQIIPIQALMEGSPELASILSIGLVYPIHLEQSI